MSERQQQRLSGAVRRTTTRRTVDAQPTFQAEIDNWIAVANKSSSNKQQEQEAHTILTTCTLTKLRDLQKEICQTNWMFDSNYP